ncbi:MAG: hypothetical protein ABIP44_04520 [Pseudoxanthomonas sp.]
MGTPVVSTECHCNSCRSAGARLRVLAGAPSFLESNGGPRFVLYRKDRVRVLEGAALLQAFRLTPGARTRRIVASCCNTPVFLEFQGGHWLTLYACLWNKQSLPPLEPRTMTGDRTDNPPLSGDLSNLKRQSSALFAKLLGAWIAMGFRGPKITVNGELHA